MDAYSLVSYHFHEINRLQSFMLGNTTFGLLLGEKGIGKSLFVRNLTIHLLDEQLQGNLSIFHYILKKSSGPLQAHLPESSSKTIKLQPEFHKLVCSNKPHLLILDQAENLTPEQIQFILNYTWKRVRVLLVSNRSLSEFFDPYVDSQVTWLSGVPFYQRHEFIKGINKSLKAKGQKSLNEDVSLKRLESCHGHRGLLFENTEYLEYLSELGIDSKPEDIVKDPSSYTEVLFSNCLLRDPNNSGSLCGTLRPKGTKKWKGNLLSAEKWARRNFQSMEAEEAAIAKAYDCWQLGVVFSEVFENTRKSLGKEYLSFTNSVLDLASGKPSSAELSEQLPAIHTLRHAWIKAIYLQDQGAIQELGDQILFDEFEFSEDYFLQLQLLQIEVLIQRRRYTQAEEHLAELVAQTLDGDGGLQCHLLCWEMMLAFFQNRNAHCLMLCDYLTAFAKDVLSPDDPLNLIILKFYGLVLNESEHTDRFVDYGKRMLDFNHTAFSYEYKFETGFNQFVSACIEGNTEEAQNHLSVLSSIESKVHPSHIFRSFYAGYLLQKIVNPWDVTSFDMIPIVQQPPISYQALKVHIQRLEFQFGCCVCVNGQWNTVSKAKLRELSSTVGDFDLYFDFNRLLFHERAIGETGLDKSRVSQLIFLILVFARGQRYSLEQLFTGIHNQKYNPEVDEPTIRVAVSRMKKRLEVEKDQYIAVGLSDGRYHLRDQTRYLVVLPDTEVAHFRSVIDRVQAIG